jgi:hypothetical protein
LRKPTPFGADPIGGEGDVLDHVAARHRQVHRLAAEEAPAALHDRVEHRLRVGDRAADDAQDLRGRRLPLERFLGLVESRTFSIAITAWSAKVCSSST